MEHSRVQFNKNSEERRKRRTKILFVLLLLLMLVLAATIGFLRKRDLQITSVTVSGTQAIDPDQITRATERMLAGNYLWVIPKTNTLLFSKYATRNYLLSEFPGLRDITIKFISPSQVHVSVVERESDHIWCDQLRGCYFLDPTGVLYRESPQFSDGVYTYFSGYLLETPSEDQSLIRGRFVTAGDYQRLLKLYELVSRAGIGIHEIAVDKERDVAIRSFTLKTYRVAPTAIIKVRLDDEAQKIIDNLELLLADRGFINALIVKGGDLETIDLRFTGKIFYKFKNAGNVDVLNADAPVVPVQE